MSQVRAGKVQRIDGAVGLELTVVMVGWEEKMA